MAHDFNNILCAMLGHVALLKKKAVPEEADFKRLDTIEKAGFRAAELIKQLLTFSRHEMTDRKPVDLNECVKNIIGIIRNTISKLISVEFDLDPGLPSFMGDCSQIEQVVMNLCVNARDAMPDGGRLYIATRCVALSEVSGSKNPEAVSGDYVKLTIADSGTGIDKNIVQRIFEPFFSTKEIGKGTGLGLSIVYGIVKGHQGFCEVETALDRGTSFHIFLPALEREKQAQAVGPGNAYHARGTVLVVDDENLVNEMLGDCLRDMGCSSYIASNGEEAIDMLSQHVDDIDLVILDVNMPVMGGKAAFPQLKALKPDLKFVITSGHPLDETCRSFVDNKSVVFVLKPFRMDHMAGVIAHLLRTDTAAHNA